MKSLWVLMVVVVLLAGCAQQAPAPAPTPAPALAPALAPTPAPAPAPTPAPMETIELRLSTHLPPQHYMVTSGYDPWAKQLEERTGGRVEILPFHSGALNQPGEAYELTRSGSLDVALIVTSLQTGLIPLADFTSVPYLVPSDDKGEAAVQMALDKYIYPRYFSDLKVLWYHRFPPTVFHTVSKPVRTLEDVNGLVMGGSAGRLGPAYIKALGGSPEAVPPTDAYTAMERGVVDGVFYPLQMSVSFRFQEVEKYVTLVNIGSAASILAMNQDKWNSLPPDIQKVFDELSPMMYMAQYKAGVGFTKKSEATIKEAGIEVIQLPPEEEERWKQQTKNIEDEWVADMDAKGLPATQLVNDIRQSLAN